MGVLSLAMAASLVVAPGDGPRGAAAEAAETQALKKSCDKGSFADCLTLGSMQL